MLTASEETAMRTIHTKCVLTLDNGERLTFEPGAAVPPEHARHWYVLLHSHEPAPVIDPEAERLAAEQAAAAEAEAQRAAAEQAEAQRLAEEEAAAAAEAQRAAEEAEAARRAEEEATAANAKAAAEAAAATAAKPTTSTKKKAA
jgi:hypothetical protein